jgi:hypothetical protein
MAGIFDEFLRGAFDGFVDPDGIRFIRDYTHASKTFVSTAYANAPKFKWLFHVYFEINKEITDNIAKVFPDSSNPSLLVKSIDLPTFSMPLQELNQYNRKRYIQTKINYNPINVTFHDDNANVIRHLWFTYYSYYYNDPNQPNTRYSSNMQPEKAASDLNRKNVYKADISQEQNWGYIGEISNSQSSVEGFGLTKIPFFKSISIFGFNQHNFAQYQLINPIIESFSHDSYNYFETAGTMENRMTLRYESVKYYDGALDGQKPDELVKRFGESATYDRTLSYLAIPGSNRSILGQGGLLESTGGVIQDVADGNYLRAIQTASRTARTFKNGSNVIAAAKTEVLTEVQKAIENNRGNFNFPASGSQTGAGSQKAGATNVVSTNAPPIAIPSNSTLNNSGGGAGGGSQ